MAREAAKARVSHEDRHKGGGKRSYTLDVFIKVVQLNFPDLNEAKAIEGELRNLLRCNSLL